MKAKVDTGARTSALHAFRLRYVEEDGLEKVSFVLHPRQRSRNGAVTVVRPITGFRKVRSSNGKVERRPVITTSVRLGDQTWPVDLTLTSRDEMGFRMLLGRAALRNRFLVHPGRSYVQTESVRTAPAKGTPK
jgi:hypothetical protein